MRGADHRPRRTIAFACSAVYLRHAQPETLRTCRPLCFFLSLMRPGPGGPLAPRQFGLDRRAGLVLESLAQQSTLATSPSALGHAPALAPIARYAPRVLRSAHLNVGREARTTSLLVRYSRLKRRQSSVSPFECTTTLGKLGRRVSKRASVSLSASATIIALSDLSTVFVTTSSAVAPARIRAIVPAGHCKSSSRVCLVRSRGQDRPFSKWISAGAVMTPRRASSRCEMPNSRRRAATAAPARAMPSSVEPSSTAPV